MKPELQAGTVFVYTSAGVYFRGNTGSYLLEGTGAAEFFRRVVPHLNGRNSLQDLTDAVPNNKAAILKETLDGLAERGVIRDAAVSLTPGPSRGVSEFLSYFADHPGCHVEAARGTAISAVGHAEDAGTLRDALLGVGFTAEQITISDLRSMEAGELSGDIILCLADQQDLENNVARIARMSDLRRLPFLAAVRYGDFVTIGPLTRPGADACVTCLHHSLGAEPDQRQRRAPDLTTYYASTCLAFQALKYLARLEDPARMSGRTTIFQMTSLSTSEHVVTAHPACDRCTAAGPANLNGAVELLAAIPLDRVDAPWRLPGLSDEIERIRDARTGIVRSLSEGEFYQLPLIRSKVVVSLRESPERDEVWIASGLDYYESRERALRVALEAYCNQFPDVRGGLKAKASDLAAAGYPVWAQENEQEERLWYWGVRVPELELILAPASFSGVVSGSGFTYGQLIQDCMLKAALKMFEPRVFSGSIRVSSLPIPDDLPVLHRYTRMLEDFGLTATLFHMESPLTAPVVGCRVLDHAAIGTGPTLETAATEALLRMVQWTQGTTNQEASDTGVHVAPALDLNWMECKRETIDWSRRTNPQTLLQGFVDAGLSGIVQPNICLALATRKFLSARFRFIDAHAQVIARFAGGGR